MPSTFTTKLSKIAWPTQARLHARPPVLADRKQIPEVRLAVKAWAGTGFLTANFPQGETANLLLSRKTVNGDPSNLGATRNPDRRDPTKLDFTSPAIDLTWQLPGRDQL